MIASRCGNHSLGSLFGGEREQFVQRAPLFESSGSLLIVELEKYLVLGKLPEKVSECVQGETRMAARIRPIAV